MSAEEFNKNIQYTRACFPTSSWGPILKYQISQRQGATYCLVEQEHEIKKSLKPSIIIKRKKCIYSAMIVCGE